MNRKHFMVVLKNGESYHFGKKCDIVTHRDEHFAIFYSGDVILAMIPYDQIRIILNVTEDGKYE